MTAIKKQNRFINPIACQCTFSNYTRKNIEQRFVFLTMNTNLIMCDINKTPIISHEPSISRKVWMHSYSHHGINDPKKNEGYGLMVGGQGQNLGRYTGQVWGSGLISEYLCVLTMGFFHPLLTVPFLEYLTTSQIGLA